MSATILAASALPTSSTNGGDALTFNIYGYDPSLAAAIVFIVAFSLITIVQTGLIARSRIWWLTVLIVGGVGEIIGWAGRLWSALNVYSLNAFLVQEIWQVFCPFSAFWPHCSSPLSLNSLILAPCFFSATVYGILGMLVRAIGPEYSILRPALYLWVFCLCDLIAIVIQAVGGAKAALALQASESSSTGTHIMLAGIVFQLFSMAVFCCIGLDFFRRARKDPLYSGKHNVREGRIGLLGFGLTWGSTWILIRCIYRTVELAEGWSGYLITHEPYFCVLDSMSMVLCQAVFCFTWPSWCLPDFAILSRTRDIKVNGADATGDNAEKGPQLPMPATASQ
ncbi:hypothetical protein JCM1841_001681 [Sporobolomyces salmonicolor]